mmetsp:Transcript_12346/g.26673  ORF Transcript_12346/g.26673 Transcript_12346/m.26673 type:complete len:97 (-) Transcript_12346:1624-1914(-)
MALQPLVSPCQCASGCSAQLICIIWVHDLESGSLLDVPGFVVCPLQLLAQDLTCSDLDLIYTGTASHPTITNVYAPCLEAQPKVYKAAHAPLTAAV